MQTGVAQTAVLHTSLSRFFPSHDYYLFRIFTLQEQRSTSKKDVLDIKKPIAGFLGTVYGRTCTNFHSTGLTATSRKVALNYTTLGEPRTGIYCVRNSGARL